MGGEATEQEVAVAVQTHRDAPSSYEIVNSSAYGVCVFAAEDLPRLKAYLLETAEQATKHCADSSSKEDIRGTILLAEEGVNIRLSGTSRAVEVMKAALRGLHPDLQAMEFKVSLSDRLTLPRLLIKLKKEVISMGDDAVKPAVDGRAQHISAEEFKQWMDEERDVVVLDTRNDYEVRLGTFERAVDLNIKSFRAFPATVKQHLQEMPKEKPVVMFCTGGVRCEKAAYTLLKDGHKSVYQLDGGILKYFEHVGGAHYRGDCYIFDDRVALTPELKESATVACYACRSPLTAEEQQSCDYVPVSSVIVTSAARGGDHVKTLPLAGVEVHDDTVGALAKEPTLARSNFTRNDLKRRIEEGIRESPCA